MHEIRRISREILAEKMKMSDAETTASSDTDAKRDIMSLLVRARRAEKGTYALSDEALVNQMVCWLFRPSVRDHCNSQLYDSSRFSELDTKQRRQVSLG